jgi:hypothetical protein
MRRASNLGVDRLLWWRDELVPDDRGSCKDPHQTAAGS